MNKILSSIILILAVSFHSMSTVPAVAASSKKASKEEATTSVTDIASVTDLSNWMTYYYLHPQPELLVPALLLADKQGLFQGDSAPPLQAFAGRVMAQNPDKIKQWFADLSTMSDNGKTLVLTSIWWANTAAGKELLDSIAKQLPEKSKAEFLKQIEKAPIDIDKLEIESPDVLDMLWACFSATGDEKYVKRLISVLAWGKSERDLNKMIIVSAARWSLQSNVQQHPKVKEICESIEKENAELKPAIEKVLADAEAASKTEKAGAQTEKNKHKSAATKKAKSEDLAKESDSAKSSNIKTEEQPKNEKSSAADTSVTIEPPTSTEQTKETGSTNSPN